MNSIDLNNEIQKKKSGGFGKLILWMIILSIFGYMGYLIYQNDGKIPSDGFNISATTEEVIEKNSQIPEEIEVDDPMSYSIVQKIRSIQQPMPSYPQIGVGYLYHKDSNAEYSGCDDHMFIIKTVFGIDSLDGVVGVADTTTISENKAFSQFLIEFEEPISEELGNQIKAHIKPENWLAITPPEYHDSYLDITDDEMFADYKGRFFYVILIDEELMGIGKAPSPEKFGKTFLRTAN